MKRLTFVVLILSIHLTAMAKEITTKVTITSSPKKIWAILTDFENYPNWNPFITSISGNVEVGNKITVKIKPPGSRTTTFKPTVLSYDQHSKLSWRGTVLFNGLFDGTHTFELIDNGNGTTTVIQREAFKGMLVWLFNTQKTEEGFKAMNKKLKEMAENQQLH